MARMMHMLTTVDNPWDPFTQFDEWFQFDVSHGYNTSAYLARIVRSSDDMSEAVQDVALEQAINEIVEFNLLGIYKKVSKKAAA
jgi:hypothetical protein